MNNHLRSIDALRGVFALLVLFYHTSEWLQLPYPQWIMSSLRVWGIYGVEGFFVISGLALTLSTTVNQLSSFRGYLGFIVRRYSRILPLYLVLFLVYTMSFEMLWQRKLELLMLFGFTNPAKATVIAGWSIGVEFVFYFIFPLIIIFCRDNIKRITIIALISTIFLFLSSKAFNPSLTLGQQNKLYVSPINHIFFFACGCALGMLRRTYETQNVKMFNPINVILLCMAIFLLICFVGRNADQIELMLGYKRLFLSILIVLMVGTLVFIQTSSKYAVFLGNISYALYLLHPVMVFVVLPFIPIENAWHKLGVIFSLTIGLAFISYRYFEMPAQKMIRQLLHA